MINSLGTCCKCGEEIGPYDRAEEDMLCKQCFYETLWRGARHSATRHNGTRIPTPYERQQCERWKDRIHAKIDREALQPKPRRVIKDPKLRALVEKIELRWKLRKSQERNK